MKEGDAIQFYVQELIAFARTLPLSQAVAFLHGALAVAGDHEAVDLIRQAYIPLVDADEQLALIAHPQAQGKFNFGKDGAK